MLQVEIKKIVFHQKWLLLLLLSLAFYAVLCTVGGYDSSYVIDRNEDTYLAYQSLAGESYRGEVKGDGVRI